MARIRTIKPETPMARWRREDMRVERPNSVLYVLNDSDGRPLYVGVSTNPIERLRAHSYVKPWWGEVATITLVEYPSNRQALEAERAVIHVEAPMHNVRSRVEA